MENTKRRADALLFVLLRFWEQIYTDGKQSPRNIYAKREECEEKLVEMIERAKAEIAEEKAKQNEGTD